MVGAPSSCLKVSLEWIINPLQVNVPSLYFRETSENPWFINDFRELEMEHWLEMGLSSTFIVYST